MNLHFHVSRRPKNVFAVYCQSIFLNIKLKQRQQKIKEVWATLKNFPLFCRILATVLLLLSLSRPPKQTIRVAENGSIPGVIKKHWSHIATTPVNAYRAEIIQIFLLRTGVNGYGWPLPRNLFCVVRRLFLSFFCDVRDNVGCVLRTISISANSHVIDSSQPVAPTNLVNGAWNAPCRASWVRYKKGGWF